MSVFVSTARVLLEVLTINEEYNALYKQCNFEGLTIKRILKVLWILKNGRTFHIFFKFSLDVNDHLRFREFLLVISPEIYHIFKTFNEFLENSPVAFELFATRMKCFVWIGFDPVKICFVVYNYPHEFP